jgi:hypothetical protein
VGGTPKGQTFNKRSHMQLKFNKGIRDSDQKNSSYFKLHWGFITMSTISLQIVSDHASSDDNSINKL